MSPIIFSANSVEKMQVFWAWSSLRMSACTVPADGTQHLVADARVGLGVAAPVARHAEQPQAEPVVALGQLAAVAGAAPARQRGDRASSSLPGLAQVALALPWSIAAFRKKASSIGAGPLMVIDTDVVAAHRSKPE